ncbi:outer membrane protein [Ferrovibrio sp.]|uniref:outer membrane protein n=1 Tax=Ferrovibrio sp. TaxID=1917215 RepID=UPI0035B13728
MAMAIVLAAGGSRAADDLTWSGPYTGVTAGAAISKAEMGFGPTGTFITGDANDVADGNFWRRKTDLDSATFTGSLYGGYQVKRGGMVYGLEAEAGYLGLNESSSVTATVPASGNPYRLEQKVETDFFANLRPRVGYVPEALSGNLLLFATGGVSLTHARVDQKFRQTNNAYRPEALSEDRLLLGWTAGGGLEYALSKNWSLKAEYLYAYLGKVEKNGAQGTPANFAGYTTDNEAELTAHIIRVGTAWHF